MASNPVVSLVEQKNQNFSLDKQKEMSGVFLDLEIYIVYIDLDLDLLLSEWKKHKNLSFLFVDLDLDRSNLDPEIFRLVRVS